MAFHGARGMGQAPAAFTGLAFAMAMPLAAGAEGTGLPEIEAGSSVFWTSYTDGSATSFRERVIAVGEDWVLYESVFEDSYYEPEASSENYFLLFGGIDYRSCYDTPQPSKAERRALKALRPFREGETVELTSLEEKAVVTVGEATEIFLMGQYRPAHRLRIAQEDESADDENLIVLDEVDLTVGIDWDAESRDRVTLFTRAKSKTPPEFTEAELGTCASILNEE